jgi:hypothetical protein
MPQEMVMVVPGSNFHLSFEWPYKNNDLYTGFDYSVVYSSRDSVDVWAIWPPIW